MKKKFTVILLIMAMAFASFCLASCGDDDIEDRPVNPQPIVGDDKPEAQISDEDAKDLVLSRINGATENEIITFKQEVEDGRLVYEGTILHEGIEYEFEIDANSGQIIEWDIDD